VPGEFLKRLGRHDVGVERMIVKIGKCKNRHGFHS
jgi:hypothetical protein